MQTLTPPLHALFFFPGETIWSNRKEMTPAFSRSVNGTLTQEQSRSSLVLGSVHSAHITIQNRQAYRTVGEELRGFIPLILTCKHLPGADFLIAGTFAAFGLGVSRELLGLCWPESDFMLVPGLARVFKVLLDFPAVTV